MERIDRPPTEMPEATQPSDSPSPRERDLFLEALEFAEPSERAAFLAHACTGDKALRAAVDSLLECVRDDDFLERPLVDPLRANASTVPTFGLGDGGPAGGTESADSGDWVGPYKLLQQIGQGGVGTVFMAEQREPVRRHVALKVIKAGMDTRSVIARFETERQALAMMDHPNIAKVLDAGSTPTGRPFFVMELVRGSRITTYCDENHLSTRQRLRLFIQVCQAIQHAHQKGIVHRDIKPSNILVTQSDGIPAPKVIDFGIAKAMDQRLKDKTLLTEVQAFVGTPAYMSPEQADIGGLDIDTRTDVYSLGVLLYELLTGHTPFSAQELIESGLHGMRRTLRECEPITPSNRLRRMADSERTLVAGRHRLEPSRLISILSGDLDWIVLKALEKDRSRRYATATSLAQDIQLHLDDEPITARPPSALYRFGKFVRRNRLGFAATGATAAALVLGLALATWQYIEKSAALLRVESAEQEQRTLRFVAEKAQTTENALRRQAEDHEFRARQRAYAADINLAQHALSVNNLGRAQELLNRQIPAPGEADNRGWEWRYLARQCQSDALFELPREASEIASVALSNDGHWLASATAAGDLVLFDLRSRTEAARMNVGRPMQIAFSPTSPVVAFNAPSLDQPPGLGSPPPRGRRDGNPQRIRLWDAVEHRFIHEFNTPSEISCLAFSTNGTLLAAIGTDSRVIIHDLTTQSTTTTPQLPGLRGGSGITELSADLTLAAYNVGPNTLRVAEVMTGRVLWSARAADETLRTLAFSPDGRILASAAGFVESSIRLWDVSRGKELTRLEGHRGWVGALAFWPDGRRLASASADQTIRLWDVTNLSDDPQDAAPSTPASSPAPSSVSVAGSNDGTAIREIAILRGHRLEVWSLALGSDGSTLASGSKDGSLLVWDATSPRRQRSHVVLPQRVHSWRFERDSAGILTGDERGRVARWAGEDFQDPTTILELGPSYRPHSFSPDGRFLIATGPPGRPMKLWDLQKRETIADDRFASNPRLPAGFVPGSNHLLTRRFPDGVIEEWDTARGEILRSMSGHQGFTGPGNIVVSPNAHLWLFGLHRGQTLLFHESENFAVPIQLGIGFDGNAAFSPDGQRFALVGSSGTGEIWDTTPPRRTGIISGFLQGLSSVAFSEDGSRIVVGSDGREALKLWDPDDNLELITLPAEGSGFKDPAFSPDNNLLGARNGRGFLYLWRASASLPTPPPATAR